VAAFAVRAGDVDGTVVVQHKLTKRNVTATANPYDRGTTVPLVADAPEDPLGYERTHVVVYLEGEQPTTGVNVTAELSQEDRRFSPDLVVIPAGATVSFPNLDPVFHNVFSLSKIKSFDLGNYPKDHSRTVNFPKPGIVFVNCHLHPNMAAVIVVTPNRFYARPDENGRFKLTGVPPGTYTIVAWHKTAGFFRKTIEISDKHAVPVEFLVPLDVNGVQQAQR
jgi:plastocyanin